MKSTYTQCRLRNGTLEDVAWIPTKYAEFGRVLKIKIVDALTDTTSWQDGWVVIGVYGTLDKETVADRERDFTRMSTY